MLNLLDVHKQMLPNSISMIFKGTVTFELIDSITMLISNRMEQIEANVNTRRKVFSVLMECLQNLGVHVERNQKSGKEIRDLEYDLSSILFMIDSIEEGYNIMTANFIANEEVKNLKKRMEEINNLSKSELKLKYNEILQNNTFSSKGGGGLGFVDIALKAGEKLEYDFQQINEELSFFSFKTTIKKA